MIKHIINAKDENIGKLSLSPSVMSIMDKQLIEDFSNKTQINNFTEREIYLDYGLHKIAIDPTAMEGKFVVELVMQVFSCPNATIAWKKTTDNPIDLSKDEINETDILFWSEDLDIEQIQDHYFWIQPRIGFKHKKLSYRFEYEFFTNDSIYLKIKFKSDKTSDIKDTIQLIDDIIGNHNDKSLARGRRYGLIHNGTPTFVADSYLEYYIDAGSAIDKPFKDMIEKISDMGLVESLIMSGYSDNTFDLSRKNVAHL